MGGGPFHLKSGQWTDDTSMALCLVIIRLQIHKIGLSNIKGIFPPQITNLHLRVEDFMGLRLGGLNGAFRYKPKGHFLYEQWEVDRFLSLFPRVDIFLSHNSPSGIHDKEDGVHCGFSGLKAYIERMKPRLLIHGHQHLNCDTQFGGTRIVGVCGYRLMEI